jgi:hypothetical protein
MNKFVVAFLNEHNAPSELIDAWKVKANLNKLKNAVRKSDLPATPPRPKSAYIFWCDIARQRIKLENPSLNIQEITCRLGKEWQEFKMKGDKELKDKIQAEFEKDRKRYNDAKKLLDQSIPDKKNKFKSTYLYFCSQERLKDPKITMKELGVRWNDVKSNKGALDAFESAFNLKKNEE